MNPSRFYAVRTDCMHMGTLVHTSKAQLVEIVLLALGRNEISSDVVGVGLELVAGVILIINEKSRAVAGCSTSARNIQKDGDNQTSSYTHMW